jgi:periplasmic protein TonB
MSDPDAEPRSSRLLWIFGGLAALALHIGGAALAVAHLRMVEPDDALGAPVIEIGLELTSPHHEPADLPAGPDTDASVASPALAEQKADVREAEFPKDVPTESDNPDRLVTPSAKKPMEEDLKVAKVETSASVESAASEATARPSSEEIPQGARSVAPARGIGASLQRLRAEWQKELMAHLDRHKRYPAERLQKNAEIVVSFVLDRMGHVLTTGIVKGSGDTAFDEAALSMIKRSDPVPQPPPAVADEGLNFTLPVIFSQRADVKRASPRLLREIRHGRK